MKRIAAIASLCSLFLLPTAVQAQVVSSATYMRAQATSDVAVPFRVQDEGVATPIEWGLDLAWLSEENVRRGVAYAGQELIDIIRTSYTATESVEGGALSSTQVNRIRQRANIIKRYLKAGVGININHDHGDNPKVADWYNAQSAGSTGRGQRWAQVIDLAIKKYAELGLTNIVSISPYNEPDYGWGQGFSASTRKADFLAIAKALKQDFDGAYDGVRICGGNTLNDDEAYSWWNYLKAQLDEGNTHQLAGDFNHYAAFFNTVRNYGHHATADELHNTMEAMVGVEYGMQTGIWWGTCEHSRSQFMKATYQGRPGKRLAYAEHRNNWTAASVYRQPDGAIQAFGGTSERQAAPTKYSFLGIDRPVWYNGQPGRAYVMSLPGGNGYQKGQTNAETVVDVQSDDDIMPYVNGTYKVVNVNSGLLLGFSANPSSSWTSATLRRNSAANYLQWRVEPMPETCGGDFSYYSFTLNNGGKLVLDILNWNLNAGADVGSYPGDLGTNEQWFLEYAGEGAFYIRSRFSAKYLEVKGGAKSAGSNVQMGDFTGSAAQQWRFVATDVTPDLVAPDAPTALEAKGQAASVALQWQPAQADDLLDYTVLRSDNGKDYYTIAKDLTTTEFTDNETTAGQDYSYQVYAVDKSLNYSERTAAVTASATDEQGCILQLPFEQNLYDTTLQGNHGAHWGAPSWTAGKEGEWALLLNGTSQFLQLPPTVANHEGLTIAAWVYWRGGDAWQRLWDFGNGTTQYMFLTPKSDSGMRFAIKNGGDEEQVRLGRNLTANKWVHVVLTLDRQSVTLYLDGEQAATNTSLTIHPMDFTPVANYIGRSQFAADPLFKGYIDDFRIYNYVLSAEEVSAIATGTDAIGRVESEPATPQGQQEAYTLSGRRYQRGDRGVRVTKGRITAAPLVR